MTTDGQSTKADQRSLSETAYEAIKGEILSASLRPGEFLNELPLAQRLGISKTPVREALRRLTQERLVEAIPRKGYVVGSISITDVVEVFTLRRILEPHLASMAARQRTAAQMEALRRTVALDFDSDNGLEAIRNSHAIHEMIAEIAGNSRARAIVDSLLIDSARIPWLAERLDRYHSGDHPEHIAIVDSIDDGDGQSASAAMAAHLEAALTRLMAVDLTP